MQQEVYIERYPEDLWVKGCCSWCRVTEGRIICKMLWIFVGSLIRKSLKQFAFLLCREYDFLRLNVILLRRRYGLSLWVLRLHGISLFFHLTTEGYYGLWHGFHCLVAMFAVMATPFLFFTYMLVTWYVATLVYLGHILCWSYCYDSLVHFWSFGEYLYVTYSIFLVMWFLLISLGRQVIWSDALCPLSCDFFFPYYSGWRMA